MTPGFRREEMETYLRALFAMAWADRTLHPEEAKALGDLIELMDPPEELKLAAIGWLEDPVGLEGIDWSQLTEPARETLLLSAWLLAQKDGRIDDRETDLLAEMARKMSIPESFLEDVRTGRRSLSVAYLADLPEATRP